MIRPLLLQQKLTQTEMATSLILMVQIVSTIQGFTLTGVVLSGYSSSVIALYNSANVVFRDIIMSGNTNTTGGVRGGAISVSNASPEFDNITIQGFWIK